MKKKLLLVMLTSLCLTGCSFSVGNEKPIESVGKAEESASEKIGDVVDEAVDSAQEILVDQDDLEGEVTNVAAAPIDTKIVDWSIEDVDPIVMEAMQKINDFYKEFGGMDYAYMTNGVEKPVTPDLDVYDFLEAYLTVKYSAEWDIGSEPAIAAIEWSDYDELARLFGFTSEDGATNVNTQRNLELQSEVPSGPVKPYVTAEYLLDYIPTLDQLDFNDGSETTTIKIEDTAVKDAYACVTTDGKRCGVYIPLVGNMSVEYSGNVYWILVPSAYNSYYDDMHFDDSNGDVKIYADWEQLLKETNGMAHACDLSSYIFTEDHGIVIVSDEWLAACTEDQFRDIVKYMSEFVNTDYSTELLEFPTVEELDKYEKPYDIWYDYFGITDNHDGAEYERLAGDNSYWDTHEIGVGRVAE
ncbi:MAG: hypothetical protein NC548_11325 [Lachnospiraceae bacterium]|nr:hypothetical protein [Lachnospiraceae bacterium]